MSHFNVGARADEWARAIGSHHYSLDAAPCDPADLPLLCATAIQTAGLKSSLVVVQRRDQAKSIEHAIRERIPDASVQCYPSRRGIIERYERCNCQNMTDVERAIDIGLPPIAAVCPVCPHRAGCQYLAELEETRQQSHAVMTTARGVFTDLEREASECDGIFIINNRALDVLSPSLNEAIPIDDARHSLAAIARAARRCEEIIMRAEKWENFGYFIGIQRAARNLECALKSQGFQQIALPPGTKPPELWPLRLMGVLDNANLRVCKHLMRVCSAAAEGKLSRLDCIITNAYFTVNAYWLPRRPSCPVLVADTTINTANLNAVTRGRVYSIPTSFQLRDTLQVPQRATGKKRPGAIAKLVRGYLTMNPRGTVGVVHIDDDDKHDAIMESLLVGEKERVRLATWGEVATLAGCDLVLFLGTSPVPPEAVIQRLTQIGQTEAAAIDGWWGERVWEGRFEDGQSVLVRGNGYRHVTWQNAYQELQQGRLFQALASVPGPKIVISDESLGLPLTRPPPALSERALAVLEAVRRLTPKSATSFYIGTEYEDNTVVSSLQSDGRALVAKMGVKSYGFHASNIASMSGVPVSTVKRLLAELETAGLVRRISPRGGWLAVLSGVASGVTPPPG